MYGPYHGGGGGAVSNNSGGGMGGMGGIGVGGGGLGHYIPGPSIYTSYAHPHQHQNPYTHLPLFPQVCAGAYRVLYLNCYNDKCNCL